MTIPDNRISFPAPKIDFVDNVGLTGQDHDNYPPPQGQARYDHLRLYLIGLLAQQASYSPPTQFREGTPWFDLNSLTLKIRKNNSWVPYAQALAMTTPDQQGNVITLSDWYTATQAVLVGLAPEVLFSGQCTADGITTIAIPQSVQSVLSSDSRTFIYINGSLVDPHNCTLIGSPPTTLRLSNITLNRGDNFIVNIRRISASTFLASAVSVP